VNRRAVKLPAQSALERLIRRLVMGIRCVQARTDQDGFDQLLGCLLAMVGSCFCGWFKLLPEGQMIDRRPSDPANLAGLLTISLSCRR
jgi:hypothetical protein